MTGQGRVGVTGYCVYEECINRAVWGLSTPKREEPVTSSTRTSLAGLESLIAAMFLFFRL